MKVTAHFKNIKTEIRSVLADAKETIVIAMAWLKDEDIIRDLANRCREIKVQIALSNAADNFENIAPLKEYIRFGGQLFVSEGKFIHHKFCLVDSRCLITGSYNWTYSAENLNEEHILIMRDIDETLAKQFDARFRFICREFCRESQTLSDFRKVDGRAVLIGYDAQEIALRQHFEAEIKKGTEIAKFKKLPLNYNLISELMGRRGGA